MYDTYIANDAYACVCACFHFRQVRNKKKQRKSTSLSDSITTREEYSKDPLSLTHTGLLDEEKRGGSETVAVNGEALILRMEHTLGPILDLIAAHHSHDLMTHEPCLKAKQKRFMWEKKRTERKERRKEIMTVSSK